VIVKGGGDYKNAPAGLHQAVCVDVVDLGVIETSFGNKHMCRLVWQIEEIDSDTGRPFSVGKRYSPSLHEKATLRKDLESWRAKPFTKEELDGFDLEKLLGVNCQLMVIHETREGKTYANIKSIVPVGKGAQPLRARDYTRVKDREATKGGVHQNEPEPGADFDTDTPF